jgi:hypothetical protein
MVLWSTHEVLGGLGLLALSAMKLQSKNDKPFPMLS